MRDKNIVIAVLAGSMLALAACGGINSIKTGGAEETAVQSTVEMPNPWSETADLDEAEKATGVATRINCSRQFIKRETMRS